MQQAPRTVIAMLYYNDVTWYCIVKVLRGGIYKIVKIVVHQLLHEGLDIN